MASKRHLGRIIALRALYEVDAVDHQAPLVVHRLAAELEAGAAVTAFALQLVQGVLQEHADLDTLLQGSAPLYPVERIAPVDRAVLRLALFELLYVAETPSKVAINEAVELAKEYGGDTSSSFINGVLGGVMERHGDRIAARGTAEQLAKRR